jgi:hypothetical protein
MTKLAMTICLLLSLLPALTGCAGAGSQPQAPPQQITEPNARASVGTQNTASGPQTRASRAWEPFPPPANVDSPDTHPNFAEPNDPTATKTPEPAAAERIAGPLPTATPEPNQIAASEPNAPLAPEPNEPVSSEPNEPTKMQPLPEAAKANDLGADGLGSFYEEYTEILQEYVRPDGHVDYNSLRRKRLLLRELLAKPDELEPRVYEGWTQPEKLALWINVYNLKVLDVIARNYPIQSSWWLRLTWPPSDIRHIEGIWSDYRFIVMDEQFTLGEVERRFFRKTFGDPRVFLAITYASRSGPPLPRTPYRGNELDRQLDEQAKTFLTNGKGLRIDRNKGVVYLSALFKPTWRGKEFVARYGTDKKFKNRPPETRAVLSFITRYLTPDDVYFLEVENYSLEYTNFDWRLDDASNGH